MKKRKILVFLLFSLSLLYFFEKKDINVYFSSKDDCSMTICSNIDQATSSIELALYIFTDKNIFKSIENAHARGVKIRSVLEKNMVNDMSNSIVKKGLARIVSSNGIMHHKFVIIDRKIVLTGSYNYTFSANSKNDENLLLIKDRKVISRYLEEFERLWEK